MMYASFESSRIVKYVLCWVILLVNGTPLSAYAHTDTGFTHGLIDGVLNLVTSLECMMLVIAAGLLPMRGSNATVYFESIAFLFGILAGIFLYMPVMGDVTLTMIVYTLLILFGTIVLIDIGIPGSMLYVMYGLTAILLGLQLHADMREVESAKMVVMLGFIISTLVLFSLSLLAARYFKTGWQHISIRVIGSWIVAISSISLVISVSGIELS